ncbi:glycosyltransferase family 2 protein [Mycobacterium yunnanensis]|nr:glycosyltransferase [Mycobacterium yunnanensis]
MPTDDAPEWPSATWIGTLDLPVEFADSIRVHDSGGYRRARLLLRREGRPVAFVYSEIEDGNLDAARLRELVAPWNGGDEPPAEESPDGDVVQLPTMSVVICTRDRLDLLREALASVLRCDYPDFEVIVVDNASSDDSCVKFVEILGDPRVRAVTEPRPGLAVARNTGVLEARGEFVAFTDDDVVVEPRWLRWLATAATGSDRIGCVTGLVPSGELRTPTQQYFESQVHWSNNLQRTVFDMATPPPGVPLFPFQVGLYGTGASFAMPRAVVVDLGGFDEGLGVGSPTGGGEDIDMFVRVLASGRQLVYEPAAIVWHRHRADVDALVTQARGYGLGLGAWLTKVACSGTLMPLALRRAVRAAGHLHDVTAPPNVEDFSPPADLRRAHTRAVVRGPLAYATSRRQGRRARPLSQLRRGRQIPWEVSDQNTWTARLAVLAGTSGALSTLPLGAVPSALLLLVLVCCGGGSAVTCWLDLPAVAAAASVVGLSVGAIIAVATAMAWMGAWYPIPSCLVLSAAVAAAGGLRLWQASANGPSLTVP